MKSSPNSPAIAKLATAVYDNGRRGAPKAGCDCIQCFGYCMVNTVREARERVGAIGAEQKKEPSV